MKPFGRHSGVVLAVVSAALPALWFGGVATGDDGPRTGATEADAIHAAPPAGFELNVGQTDPRVRFSSAGKGFRLFLTNQEAVFALAQPGSPTQGGQVLRMRFGGAATPAVQGMQELPGRANRLVGADPTQWRTGIPRFSRVQYADVHPGVDLVFRDEAGRLEYDFMLAPGADPAQIRLGFQGAAGLAVDDRGDLRVALPGGGELRQLAPVAYQGAGQTRRPVSSQYRLLGGDRVGIEVGQHDPALPLVIDPVLSYSSFLGGGDYDSAYGIAVDADGNTYVSGLTASYDFPGASTVAGIDAFVTKVSPDGSQIVYSTTLGGSADERANGLALDALGNAYLTGRTESPDFPTTGRAYDRTCGTDGACNPDGLGPHADAFVTKLNASGSALVYSTFLGGSGYDNGNPNRFFGDGAGDIAVDGAGNAYLTGSTQSANFPVTANAFQPSNGGGICTPGTPLCQDAFVTTLNAAGTRLLYSTYLGGSDIDEGFGIALDSSRAVYVTGRAVSGNFPVTPGAVRPRSRGGGDGFVTKFRANGTGLAYSTYLGGSGTDTASAIAVRGREAYVTGYTSSFDFPTTPGVFQPAKSGDFDAFVTRLTAAGSRFVYSSYLGGLTDELSDGGIAVDATGRAYVTGTTESGEFPQRRPLDGCTRTLGMFVTVVQAAGSGLDFSTCIDGGLNDYGTDIAVDAAGAAHVTGHSASSGSFSTQRFPTTAGAFQPGFEGGALDAVVVRIEGPPLTSP
ncbi:MAG: SBBP repeat-containing protein [Geodermatophilaceae bacterium]